MANIAAAIRQIRRARRGEREAVAELGEVDLERGYRETFEALIEADADWAIEPLAEWAADRTRADKELPSVPALRDEARMMLEEADVSVPADSPLQSDPD